MPPEAALSLEQILDAHVPCLRDDVVSLVKENPGIPLRRLAELARAHIGTIAYHVEQLERDGVLRTVRAGRRRLVFPVEQADVSQAIEASMLRHASTRRLALAILDGQAGSVAQLADAVRLSRRATYHHVRRLRNAGLIAVVGHHRFQLIVGAEKMRTLLSSLEREEDGFRCGIPH